MNEKKFNNKQNERVVYDGKEHWISRSVAVVGVVFAVKNNTVYTLVTKRSEIMDHPFKLCVPCGYLDWNESCYEAMVREVCEETSLYLPNYKDNTVEGPWHEIPIRIQDDPTKDARQNISFTYCTVLDFNKCPDKFPSSILKFKTNETLEVDWVAVNTINDEPDSNWAFKHNELINLIYQYVGLDKK